MHVSVQPLTLYILAKKCLGLFLWKSAFFCKLVKKPYCSSQVITKNLTFAILFQVSLFLYEDAKRWIEMAQGPLLALAPYFAHMWAIGYSDQDQF